MVPPNPHLSPLLGSPRGAFRMTVHVRRHHFIRTTYQKTTKKEGTLEQNSKGGGGGRIGLDKGEQTNGAEIRSDPALYFNSLKKLLIF